MSQQKYLAFFILAPALGSSSVSSQSADGFSLTLATVDSVKAARNLAGNLKSQGVTHIELSSSFGDEGLAVIREAVGEGIEVARVRSES